MLASRLYALGILLFTLSWLAYDHYRPWVNFHSEALALAGVGLMAFSYCVGRGARSVSTRAVLWTWVVAFIPWVQYLFGIELFAGDAVVASLYLFGFGASIWLGFRVSGVSPGNTDYVRPTEKMKAIYYSLWIAALVSAAIGLLQWLSLQGALQMYALQTDVGDRAMGNLGQPNQLATLLLIGIAALAWTYESNRIGKIGLVSAVGFLTLVLVLTQSRSGMISVVVMGIFLIWKNRRSKSQLKASLVLWWILAYFVCLLLLPDLFDILLMQGNRSMNPGSDSARIVIWKQMISGIMQAPWFGYGWNGTSAAHAAGSIAVPGSLTYTNAHNVILDIVAWNGIPVGLFLTAISCYWFLSRVLKIQKLNAVYSMACLLPIAVHSMVEYPFAYSYFLVTAGIMVGVVEASHPRIATFRLRPGWLGGILLAWFALGGYIIHEYLLAEEDFRIVRFENLRIGTTQADYKVPKITLLSNLGSMLTAARQQPTRNMSSEELLNLEKTSLRFSYGSLALRNAIALGLNGNPERASRQMAVIKGMYGEFYYRSAVSVLRELERDKYPELAKVITP